MATLPLGDNFVRDIACTLATDWEKMRLEITRHMDQILFVNQGNGRFEIEDRVGIYDGLGKIQFKTRYDEDAKRFLLRYEVIPTAVYPRSQVRGVCDTPHSYSEINAQLTVIAHNLLNQRFPRSLGWTMPRVIAEPVKPYKKYVTRLVFEWGSHYEPCRRLRFG